MKIINKLIMIIMSVVSPLERLRHGLAVVIVGQSTGAYNLTCH